MLLCMTVKLMFYEYALFSEISVPGCWNT